MLPQVFRLTSRTTDAAVPSIDAAAILGIFRSIEDKETRKVFKNAYELLTLPSETTLYEKGCTILDLLFKELDRLDAMKASDSFLFGPIRQILSDLVYLTKSSLADSKSLVSRLRVWIAKTSLSRNASPHSKKWLVVDLLTSLMKIRFRLNQISELKQELRGINTFPLEDHSASLRATYAYYSGRLKLMEDEYEEALKELDLAYNLMENTPGNFRNKQRVFMRLFPLKLVVSGQICSVPTLTTYRALELFGPLSLLLRQGDAYGYENHLRDHAKALAKLDVLQLLLRRGLRVTQRVCLKRLPRSREGKNDAVQLDAFSKVLRPTLEDASPEDALGRAECVFANLVGEGLVKGKILHDRHIVVLTSSNPFPSLSEGP